MLRGLASVASHLFNGINPDTVQAFVLELQRRNEEEQQRQAMIQAQREDDNVLSPLSHALFPGEWAPRRNTHARPFNYMVNDEFGRAFMIHFNHLPSLNNEQVNFDPDTGNVGNTGVDQILNTIFEQYQPSGPPPTDPNALRDILSHEVTVDAALKENVQSCSVCMADYEIGEKVIKLPCDHVYHRPCIEKWLEEHNTCPICRKEFQPARDAAPGQQAARPQRQPSPSPAPQQRPPRSPQPARSPMRSRRNTEPESDPELERAIAASLQDVDRQNESVQPRVNVTSPTSSTDDDRQLQMALAESKRDYEREQRRRQQQRETEREGREDFSALMPGLGGRSPSPRVAASPAQPNANSQQRPLERDESWVVVGSNNQNRPTSRPTPSAPPAPSAQTTNLLSAHPVSSAVGTAQHNPPDTTDVHRRLAAQAAERRFREQEKAAQERGRARNHLMNLPMDELVALLRAQGEEFQAGTQKEELVEKLLPKKEQ